MKHTLLKSWVLIIAMAALPAFSCRDHLSNLVLPLEDRKGVGRWMELNAPRLEAGDREKTRVEVVVPVYREWENGNIQKLIKAFAHQTAGKGSFELVLVVNNTPEVAQLKNEIWQENQATLQFLNRMNDALNGDPKTLAPEWEEYRGLRLKVVDQSTNGIPRNIGAIRDFGSKEALKPFSGFQLEDVVVSQFDADTIPSDRYVEEIQNAFHYNGLDMALLAMDLKIGRGVQREVFETFFDQAHGYSHMDLSSSLLGLKPFSGTPRIVVRASSLLKIGGVPHKEKAEDVELIREVHKLSRAQVKYLWRFPVVTSDRAREDGYDAANRLFWLQSESDPRERKAGVPSSIKVDDHFDRLLAELSGEERELVQNERALQLTRLQHEQAGRHVALLLLIKALREKPTESIRHLASGPVFRPLEEWIATNWFEAELRAAAGSGTIDEAAAAFEWRFPGFFPGRPDSIEAKNARGLATRKALHRVLSLVSEYPGNFPGIANYVASYRYDYTRFGEKELHQWLALNDTEASFRELLGRFELSYRAKFSGLQAAGVVQGRKKAATALEWLSPDPLSWKASDFILAWNVLDILWIQERLLSLHFISKRSTAGESERISELFDRITRYKEPNFQMAIEMTLLGFHNWELLQEWISHSKLDLSKLEPSLMKINEIIATWNFARHGLEPLPSLIYSAIRERPFPPEAPSYANAR